MRIRAKIFNFCLIFAGFFHTLIDAQIIRPAIRVRLNQQVFAQASSIVQGLVEYEVPRVQIPSTRQCFTEGCVDAHTFRMVSFRQPRFVVFEPHFPNKFRIRVTDFDFVVTGQLGGSITVILNIPISGSVVVTGRNIGVSAILDLQKTANDHPYFRLNECRLDNGIVTAMVSNMGLFTDTVNQKFGPVLSAQSRVQLEEAICEHINRLTQMHFSTRLTRIPQSISAKEILEIIISNNVKKPTSSSPASSFSALIRSKRATTSDDYYDDIEKTDGPAKFKRPTVNANFQKVQISRQELNNFFNIDRLSHILIDLTLLDAAATSSDFSLGISGDAYSSRSQGSSPYVVPFPFRIPQNNKRKMIEVVTSQYTLNTMLFHAHRTNSLIFHVDSKTPGIGNLLKTSCSLDEVCISDEIPKIKSSFPNRRLELIIRSAQPPTVNIESDAVTLSMVGRCIFFLEGTRQKIGVIPFNAVLYMNLRTVGSKLQGNIQIRSLDFTGDVDFLRLTIADLDGLRRTTKRALQTFISSATSQGFSLSTASIKSPLQLFNPQISFLPGAMLLQADVDLYKTLYSSRKN